MRKALQRRALTFVSSTKGATIVLLAIVVIVACFIRGSVDVSKLVVRSLSAPDNTDNIGGRSFSRKMCPEPIDVVYTWVNGSDPRLAEALAAYTSPTPTPSASPSPSASLVPSNGTAQDGTGGADATDGEGGGDGDGDEGDQQAANNRYRDNNELRYSLRSMEKYAPWVRRIFIVTNGQVPYWLNLEHPRLSLVTHEDIFPNKSHLPVFSSPAIESHLHRIPGVAKKFVYFNDDVFLGAETWPDDFYSQAMGQKAYLSWDVPKCAPGCLESWIGDGFCDQACNVSSCHFDFPDCINGTNVGGGGSSYTPGTTYSPDPSSSTNCAAGCPNSWLGDLICDTRCDTASCAWDAGDCGIEKVWGQVPGAAATPDISIPISLNMSQEAAYVNLTALFDGLEPQNNATFDSFVDAQHSVCSGIRSSLLVEPDKVLVLILNGDWARCPSVDDELKAAADTIPDAGMTPVNGSSAVGSNSTSTSADPSPTPTNDDPVPTNASSTTPATPRPLHHVKLWLKYRTSDDAEHEVGLTLEFTLPAPSATPTPSVTPIPALDPYGAYQDDYRPQMFDDDGLLFDEPAHNRRLLSVDDGSPPSSSSSSHGRTSIPVTTRAPHPVLPTSMAWFQSASPRDIARVVAHAWRRTLAGARVARQRSWFIDPHSPSHVVMAAAMRAATGDGGAGPSLGDGDGDGPTTLRAGRRRLLDTYADSLVFTNRLLNTEFARQPRKVPAHMPHMIDVDAMTSLQAKFPAQWEATSTHRFRHPRDVQFAFAYFYWLIEGGAQKGIIVEDYWAKELDTDGDGVLNDNELRTLAAVVSGKDNPPSKADIETLRRCLAPPTVKQETEQTPDGPVIVTKTLRPRITVERLIACDIATNGLATNARFPKTHEMMDLTEVSFEMVTDDYNKTLSQLDSVRARRTKFVCINDDMKTAPPEVVSILHDFYESYFPIPSSFELPAGQSNPYLHINELRDYYWQRRVLKLGWLLVCFVGCGWVLSRVVQSKNPRGGAGGLIGAAGPMTPERGGGGGGGAAASRRRRGRGALSP